MPLPVLCGLIALFACLIGFFAGFAAAIHTVNTHFLPPSRQQAWQAGFDEGLKYQPHLKASDHETHRPL